MVLPMFGGVVLVVLIAVAVAALKDARMGKAIEEERIAQTRVSSMENAIEVANPASTLAPVLR